MDDGSLTEVLSPHGSSRELLEYVAHNLGQRLYGAPPIRGVWRAALELDRRRKAPLAAPAMFRIAPARSGGGAEQTACCRLGYLGLSVLGVQQLHLSYSDSP